jgi:hypothetical protein
MIPLHKLPVGSFAFLQCLSGTELLKLSGTPYTYVICICYKIYKIVIGYIIILHLGAQIYKIEISHIYTICMNIIHIFVAVLEPGAETVDLKIFIFYNVLSRYRRSLCDSPNTSRKRDLPLNLREYRRMSIICSLVRGILDSSCLPSEKVLSRSISANRTEV